MKLLTLDHQTIDLDTSLPFGERLLIFNQIYDRYKDTIEKSWTQRRTEIFLDVLCNYLYPLDTSNRTDKLLLSKRKYREMVRGTEKYVNFSNMSPEDKILLGIESMCQD